MTNQKSIAEAILAFGLDVVDTDVRRQELLKAQAPTGSEESASNQQENIGLQFIPFDVQAVLDYKLVSIYHQTCINTKVAATVGLGHKDENTDQVLNPLCEISWQDVIESVADDYFQIGNGYIEVRRNRAGSITGLHHVKAKNVYVYLEDDRGINRHFEVHTASGETQRFARFGDLNDFRVRFSDAPDLERVSELIHLRRSNSFSRWYGFPDWLACFMTIDIAKAMREHQMSFFLNRGVPEFISWTKGHIDEDCLKEIRKALQEHVGARNAHKNLHMHFDDDDAEFHLEKLNVEAKTESMFLNLSEVTSRDIVSSHRVPPILAGILVPQRLGAANEVVNALMSFQVLVAGPEQKRLQTMLGCTLGNSELSNLGLSPESFEWDQITEEMAKATASMGEMDTISRMRQSLPEAQLEGRELSEGLRD